MREFDPCASEFISSGYVVRSRPGGALYDPGSILSVGGNLLGGIMGADAAGDAADAQAGAAAASDATQRYFYDTTRADNAPFRQTGLDANNRLAQLMGLSKGGAGNGALARNFTAADMTADPVYQSGLQFGLDQGTQGINRQAAAGGNFLSGATLKALTRFGSDYASTKGNEAFNRFNVNKTQQYNQLAGLSGAGQQATNQVSAAGQNAANQIGASQQGAGNARASGYIGQANAWGGALGQGVNAFQQNQLMKNLFPSGMGTSSTGAGTMNELADYGVF